MRSRSGHPKVSELRALLSKVSPEHQEIARLYLLGNSIKDIASMLKLKPKEVRAAKLTIEMLRPWRRVQGWQYFDSLDFYDLRMEGKDAITQAINPD